MKKIYALSKIIIIFLIATYCLLNTAFAQTFSFCPGDTITHDLLVYRGTLQWQQSVDSLAWTDISGATYQPYKTVFTIPKYFRAKITDGNCSPVYSQVRHAIIGYCSVQQRLNAGETPKQIFDSGISIDSLFGKTYQGGLIFYLNTSSGTGLVSALIDQSSGAVWGCNGTLVSGADGTAIGTGIQNTMDIVSAGCSTAAAICDNLVMSSYSDWFLPSKDELNEMYANLKFKGFGNFINYWYWSSSEYSDSIAWGQDFNNGNQFGGGDKVSNYYVRAVRAF